MSARFDSAHPHTGWRVTLDGLRGTVVARTLDQVLPAIAAAEHAAREGQWVAMMLAYEAAAAFEPALRGQVRNRVRSGADELFPYVWVGVYEQATETASWADMPAALSSSLAPSFEPARSRAEFAAAVDRIQELIRAGDTYQVNLTFPLHAPASAAVTEHFANWLVAQQANYCALLDVGSHVVLSLSPELFFERRGNRLRTRPMKGTIARGRWQGEDEARADMLRRSVKDRAENVMIVDLLRNDIGRVARTGSVSVPELFALERYPTLWQMTSTVEGEVAPATPLVDILRALFPCGSVTGAPKLRTMRIIDELEPEVRGLYTGAIGFIRPGGDCSFNVAIRTVVMDRRAGVATLGVGAGITIDSVADEEYDECLLKAAFTAVSPDLNHTSFSLLETMRLEGGVVPRLERHLTRMRESARYFGRVWDEAGVRSALADALREFPTGSWRLRLLVDVGGSAAVTCTPHRDDTRTWRLAFAPSPVEARDPFLFNKTTRRHVYDAARAGATGADEVILWNVRGEVTEATIANIVVEIDGVMWTPPISSGLLPGVLRGELVETGVLRERVLTKADVVAAARLWLINSLRGWIEARLDAS